MIDPNLVQDIFTRLGEDKWRELMDALYSRNTCSPIRIDHSDPILIELDYDSKVRLDNISSSIKELTYQITRLVEAVNEKG